MPSPERSASCQGRTAAGRQLRLIAAMRRMARSRWSAAASTMRRLAAASIGVAAGSGTDVALGLPPRRCSGAASSALPELILLSRAALAISGEHRARPRSQGRIPCTTLSGVTSLWMAILGYRRDRAGDGRDALRLLRFSRHAALRRLRSPSVHQDGLSARLAEQMVDPC